MINFWKRKELRMKIEKMMELIEYLTKYIYKENRENREAGSVDKYKNLDSGLTWLS